MDFQKTAAGDTTLTPEEQAAANALIAHVKARPQAIPKEVQLVEKQRGEALAELAIAEAKGQHNAWHRFYLDMLKLTAEGRAGFRSIIDKHRKAVRAYVKAADDATPHKKAAASALTHLSELTSISKALDAGAKFDESWPFAYAVGHARTHLENAGKKDGRGRKPTPWMDKLKAFVSKNVPKDQLHEAAELIETMSEITEAGGTTQV